VAFHVPAVSVPTPVMPVYDPDTRAVGTVPAERTEAFKAVTGILILAEPLKLVAVPVAPSCSAIVLAFCKTVAFDAVPVKLAVIVLAAKLPEASLATIVLAPLAEAAEVRALASVPADILEALSEVSPEPAPVTVVNVPTFAAKLPLASLAIIVEAPFAEDADVRALAKVPVSIVLALIDVTFKLTPAVPLKDTFAAVTPPEI
jgi:hypothetical protein